MRAYLVTVKVKGQVKGFRYAGTSADARGVKAALAERHGLGPRDKGLIIEDCEIPTAKADLLEFVNQLAERLDQEGE